MNRRRKVSRFCKTALLLSIMVMMVFSSHAYAQMFWAEHAVGWCWYQSPEERSDDAGNPSADPVQTMDALQRQVKQTLDLAILNPTVENVRNYITLQNQVSNQANRFTQVWRTVLLNFPALDYSLQHPTNSLAKQIYSDGINQQEDEAIHRLAQRSGLFFFYRSTCPYCQRFAPIVRDFAQRYGLSIIPITTDGIALPEFPDSQIDQGQAARLKVTMEPALFTVEPVRHQIIPVSYGLLSEDELRQRLLTIAQQFPIPKIETAS